MSYWIPIPITNNKYEVNSIGQIRSTYNGKLRKLTTDKDGYKVLRYRKNNRNTHTLFVHRAVSEALIANPDNKLFINHKDGDKSNNNVANLEWCTRIENMNHAFANGLVAFGEERKNSKINLHKAREIRSLYKSSNLSQAKLGRVYGLSQSVIGDIVNNLTWKEEHAASRQR